MKTRLLILFIACSIFSREINAQMKKPQKERIETMKIGFITDRLDLTPEEAKVFWPVYDKYSDELESVRKERRENVFNTRENFESMSDTEMEKAVDSEITFRQNELDILKKYHVQFKKVLPMKKVAKLYKTEEDFKRKLLEILQERKDGERKGPQGQMK
jgi:hypothetical protein